jgi:hypothetical protein
MALERKREYWILTLCHYGYGGYLQKSICELDYKFRNVEFLGVIRWRKTLYLFAFLYLFVWSSNLAHLRQCPHSERNKTIRIT